MSPFTQNSIVGSALAKRMYVYRFQFFGMNGGDLSGLSGM